MVAARGPKQAVSSMSQKVPEWTASPHVFPMIAKEILLWSVVLDVISSQRTFRASTACDTWVLHSIIWDTMSQFKIDSGQTSTDRKAMRNDLVASTSLMSCVCRERPYLVLHLKM